MFIILGIFFTTRTILEIVEYYLGNFSHVTRLDQSRAGENICFTITAEIIARSVANLYCQ